MRTRSEGGDCIGSHDMRTVGACQAALMAAARVSAPTPRKTEAPRSHSQDQASRDPCQCHDQCHVLCQDHSFPIMKMDNMRDGETAVKKLLFINLYRVLPIHWIKMKVRNRAVL